MLKKVVAVVGAAAVVTVLGLFVVGTVFAEDPTPTPKSLPPRAGFWGCVGRGMGIVGDAVTKLLGMTREQIRTERAAGKTLSQIAKEKGITDQQVIDAMLAGQKEALDQAVKDGRLTQAQADWLLARMKAMAPFELTNPFPMGGMGGGHRMMRGHGRWGKPTPTPSATSSS